MNVKVECIIARFKEGNYWMARMLLDCGHIVTRRLPNGETKRRAICGECGG